MWENFVIVYKRRNWNNTLKKKPLQLREFRYIHVPEQYYFAVSLSYFAFGGARFHNTKDDNRCGTKGIRLFFSPSDPDVPRRHSTIQILYFFFYFLYGVNNILI